MNLGRLITRVAAVGVAAAALSARADAVAPDFVTSEAVFWLDASKLEAAVGTELDAWPDVRGGSHPGVTTYTTTKPQVIEIADGALAGRKAVTFFTVGTNCDMKFASMQEIKTAFFVVDIDQDMYAFLLGGPKDGVGKAPRNYGFHRGTGGSYRYDNGKLNAVQYWNDGVAVSAPGTDKILVGYQLIAWNWSSDDSAQVLHMCSDREISGRIGGKRLCEVVAFSRELTEDERCAVEGYLKSKWWGTMSQETATFAMRVNKFGKPQVHFDASEASSFHYDVDGDETGTKVSQWDDLSGNGNNFLPSEAKSSNVNAIRYGTRGEVAGKPVFDSGAARSGIDLAINRLTNTRTVFMVAEIDRNENVFLLGDQDQYRFHRGKGGTWMLNSADSGNMYYALYGTIWQNGKKIVAPKTEYPEPSGGLTVFAVKATKNLEWSKLGQDRNIDNRNGGKRVAELITFDREFTEAECEAMTELLKEKWRPTEAYVDEVVSKAAVHVDASSADNFKYTDGKITGWKNEGTGADLVKPDKLTTVACNAGTYGFTNGVPAFLMGAAGSNIDMHFTRLTNIRTVFWAMDIKRDGNVFFLGDGKSDKCTNANTYHFHRGPMGYYANSTYAAASYKNGPIYCDDALVHDAFSERPPLGTHVFDFASLDDLTACSLGADRNSCDNGVNRNGGRALSELLIFTDTVSGLTREAIRERIEAKWTRSCGWAGAGDAEWGAGKYRVFGADAAVPAEGAAAAGVGFTADATLSGGTLALGDGGLFASEGAAVTVSAPIEGNLGVYGPGTVTLATAPVDSISVGCGATLILPAGETAIPGVLSIQENAKLVIDVSELPKQQHASVTFADLALLAGGTLLDYVSLVGDTQGHVLTIGADGKSIQVNDPGLAMAAEWNGDADDSATDAANWRCRNLNGEELPGALPCFRTTNVVFNGDCDLRGWETPVFAEGVVLDLRGYALTVADLSDDGFKNAVVTNSADGATAELRVEVADGKTAVNSTVSILGGVKVVKSGLGAWTAAKKGQTYSGGTLILEGVLESGFVDMRNNYPFGAKGSTITVSTNGANRGEFDIKGMYAQNVKEVAYKLVMNGGLVKNTGNDVSVTSGQFFDIRLTADSEFIQAHSWGVMSLDSTLDLDGHTLKVAIGTNGKIFHLVNCEVKNGFVDITSGGYFQTGLSSNAAYRKEIVATNVDFRINSALKMYAPLSVRNYEQVYGANNNDGTGVLSVHGTFKPAEHNYFYGCTMMDGSTIDLSQRTAELPAVSSFTKGNNGLGFAEGAVVAVKLGEWNVRPRSRIISWSEDAKPANVDTVKFVGGDEGRARYFSKKSDGLYLSGGFVMVVR